LIYDVNGFIAGIQAIIKKSVADSYTHLFDHDASRAHVLGYHFGVEVYFLTAYFIEPIRVCNQGRTQELFNEWGTVENVQYMTGPHIDEVASIPRLMRSASANVSRKSL